MESKLPLNCRKKKKKKQVPEVKKMHRVMAWKLGDPFFSGHR